MCCISETILLQYGCFSRIHCKPIGNLDSLQHPQKTERDAALLTQYALLSTYYVPEIPCILCPRLTMALMRAVLLLFPFCT